MTFNIDDKELAGEIAERAMQSIYDMLSREDYSTVWYNEKIANALYAGIREIVADNKDKIIQAIIDKAAEKLCKNISFAAVLAALNNKG